MNQGELKINLKHEMANKLRIVEAILEAVAVSLEKGQPEDIYNRWDLFTNCYFRLHNVIEDYKNLL